AQDVAHIDEGYMPHAEINVPDLILVGRFSSDPHWPVLGDPWGLVHVLKFATDESLIDFASAALGAAELSSHVASFESESKAMKHEPC
ncbi:MAG: hypothetical protein ACLPN2_02720, partial [Terriglobales bacterium]